MSNKFVEVTGLHKVFPVSGNTLDLTRLIPDTPFSSDSILFMTADATDETYGFDEGSTYIWARGRIYYTSDDEITSEYIDDVQLGSVYVSGQFPVNTIYDSGALTLELQPNTLYNFKNRTSNLTLTLAPEIPGVISEYHIFIECGETAPTITWPSQISSASAWYMSTVPAINANTKYEISILDNVAAFAQL